VAKARKPRGLKVIQGTFRKDRNPGNEPDPEKVLEAPKPPSSLNRWGKSMWKALAAKLVETKVLTEVDLYALEACCTQYGLYRELHDAIYHVEEAVEVDGKTVVRRRRRTLAEYLNGRNSQTMPEYIQMKGAFAQLRQYLTEFGLTPAARNRIDIPETPDEKDRMEELLNGA